MKMKVSHDTRGSGMAAGDEPIRRVEPSTRWVNTREWTERVSYF